MTGRASRFTSILRARAKRLRPCRIRWPLRIVAITCWVVVGVELLLGFVPARLVPRPALKVSTITVSWGPTWLLLVGLGIGSGALASGVVLLAARRQLPQHVAAAWCAGVALPLVPVLLLAEQRIWWGLGPALTAWLLATAIVVVSIHVRQRFPSPWVSVLLTVLVSAPWLLFAGINFALGLALLHVLHCSVTGILTASALDIGIAPVILSYAMVFVAVMTAAGMALTARTRADAAERVTRVGRGWGLAVATCAAAVAVIVVQDSGLARLSPGHTADFWAMRTPASWPHAVVVAALIVVTVRRSRQSPLRAHGNVMTIIAVVAGALAVDILFTAAITGSLIVGAVTGASPLAEPSLNLQFVVGWTALGVLACYACRNGLRHTSGQAIARVSLVYLVPVYAALTAMACGIDLPVTFWATPVQVVVFLVVICCAATVLGILGQRTLLAAEAVHRLALIPMLIALGSTWVPAVIAGPLTPVLAIVAALFALLWALPPTAAHPARHAGVVLTTSGQLVLVATAAVIVGAHPELAPNDPAIDLLWLTIPLSVLWCSELQRSPMRDKEPGRDAEPSVAMGATSGPVPG